MHKTQNIILKRTDIDIEIIPVVKWLNSLTGLYTLNSCQGEGPLEDGVFWVPYVQFMCCYKDSLNQVINKINQFNETKDGPSINLDEEKPIVSDRKISSTYHMSWPNTKSMQDFVEFLLYSANL